VEIGAEVVPRKEAHEGVLDNRHELKAALYLQTGQTVSIT
jgi:hypothetical protein